MVKARFEIRLPEGTWVNEVSRSFPSTKFRLLTGIGVDDGAVELGEIVGGAVDEVMEAFADHPDILEYEQLYADAGRALAQYRTTERSLYEFLRESSVPPEFPIVVAKGWFEFEVTATHERVRSFRSTLEESDWPHEVLSIVGQADAETLLTAQQRELLDLAVRSGYFEVPRDCTLADLAAEAGVDKSTASGVIRRGEARIVEWFLIGSGSDTGDRS